MNSGNEILKRYHQLSKVLPAVREGQVEFDRLNIHEYPHFLNIPIRSIDDISDLSAGSFCLLLGGLFTIILNRDKLLKSNLKFVTSYEVYEKLPKNLQSNFAYYRYQSNFSIRKKSDQIPMIVLDVVWKKLSEQYINQVTNKLNHIQSQAKSKKALILINHLECQNELKKIDNNHMKKMMNILQKFDWINLEDFEGQASMHARKIYMLKDCYRTGFSSLEISLLAYGAELGEAILKKTTKSKIVHEIYVNPNTKMLICNDETKMKINEDWIIKFDELLSQNYKNYAERLLRKIYE